MAKKKRSAFLPVFAILTVIILLLTIIDFSLFTVLKKRLNYKTVRDPETVDMNDSSNTTDYGRIYCAPVDEAHIKEEDNTAYIDNEVLVVANDGVTRGQVEQLASAYNAEIVGEIEVTGDYQLRLTTTPDELGTVIGNISADPIVASATPNYVSEAAEDLFESSEQFGDFYYGIQWSDELVDYDDISGYSWGIKAINTMGAWSELQGSSETSPVKVGVVDSGFYTNHEDLGFAAYFFESGANQVATNDDNKDHGTHVSGTFAASADDETGICGVYPYGNSRLYAASLKGAGLYKDLKGISYSSMNYKAAFGELIVRNVKVMNFSMGANCYAKFMDDDGNVDSEALLEYYNNPDSHTSRLDKSRVMGDYFDRLLKKGFDFVIVCSAGNDSDGYTGHLESKYNSFLTIMERDEFPDVYDRIIVVGSLDLVEKTEEEKEDSAEPEFVISEFSNGGTRTDVYAPGGEIYSAVYPLLNNGSRYGFKSGTSMASPHVSGVAAMVWSANNSLTGAQVKDIVVNSPNYRTDICNMVDADLSVQKALGVERSAAPSNSDDGMIFGYVRDKYDENVTVYGIKVTAENKDTGETYTSLNDDDGHFELIVPEGKYKLTVTADGYKEWKWPGNFSYTRSFTVVKNTIKYLDPIRLTPDGDSILTPEDGKIYTGEDIKKYMKGKYKKYDYDAVLDRVKAWTYRDGHLYAVCDYGVSSRFMKLITQQDPTVHLVIIYDQKEQELIEELITYGERDIYYTGGLVNADGSVIAVNTSETDYTHWQAGYPSNYGKEGYDDVIAVFRGSGDDPRSSADFGYWLEVSENDYSIIDIADTDLNGVSRGIIIEWDVAY